MKNNHVNNYLLGIIGIFLGIVLTCAVIIPQAVQINNWTNSKVLETAVQYWESQGYVAYADPSGTLHVNSIEPNADNTYDIGTAILRFQKIYGMDVYVDGMLYAASANVSGIIYQNGFAVPQAPGTPDYVVGVNTAADDVLGSTGYWVKSGSTGQVVGSTADANADAFIYNVIVLMESKGGGTTKFTIGTFYFAAQISTWAMRNIILEGSGQKTVFKVANGANCGIISLAYYNNHLRNLTVDGNKANQTAGGTLVTLDAGVDYTYCSIENCLVQNGWARGIGVGKQATSRFIVKNNVVTDCNLSGIMVNSIGTIVEGNHIVDCATVTESALWVHVSQGVVIANNVIDGGSVLLAQIRVSSSTDCTVLGNVCNNSLGAGIIGAGCERLAITGNSVVAPVNGGILTDSGCWGVTIASNLVKGSGTGGIYSAGGHYNIITGNIIEDCYDNGIDIGASTDVTIVGNTIRGIKKALEGLGICLNGNSGIVANNIIEFCALNGILVGGSNSDLRIVNNIVKNCRQDTIPAYPVEAGIAVHGYSNLLCTGILVQGNRVFDDQAGTSLLTADPAPGQKVVVVADGTQFKVYQAVTISDDTPDTEDNIIQSISGNTLTMRTNLANTYTMAQNAVVNGRQTQDYGVGIRNDGGATVVEVQVCDNDLDDNILGGISLTLSGGTTDTKIYRNRGYVTENSGSDNITSGSTSRVITHGCSYTPAVADITIIFSNNSTNALGNWWVDTITSTQFTVHVANDPGASHCYFSWSVRKH